MTDCWRGYIGVAEGEQHHETVNHKKEFVNANGFHTNHIERMWGAMKTQIRRRWNAVGERNLEACNGRVQVGIFFPHNKKEANSVQETMKLVKNAKILLEVLERAEEIQQRPKKKKTPATKVRTTGRRAR